MKKLSTYMLALAVLLFAAEMSAQEKVTAIPEGYELVDSVIYVPTVTMDTSLVGRNIFYDVKVNQSQNLSQAMTSYIGRNQSRAISGYRVRIYFDNSQNSRSSSEAVLNGFRSRFPGYAAYRSYVNPYFKVTVGDFRSRTEAMQLLQEIKAVYPSAFIVKENINYPVVDRQHSYVADTIKVLRRINYFDL